MDPHRPLRIAIVTDAWFPHVSGIATVIGAIQRELERMGHTVLIIGPSDFRFRLPLPGYREIKLALFAGRALARKLNAFNPDAVHIATEGPLGIAARVYCLRHGRTFTTAYHTRLPEYIHVRTGIPLPLTYRLMCWFHRPSSAVMAASPALKQELESHGFRHVTLWRFGADAEIFRPDDPFPLAGARPIFMYMGRVAIEKNLDAFLSIDLPGTKYIVGDGPARKKLEKRYPDATFTGYKFGKELARHLAAADVFVFPSLTDTFGLVMLEANACGVPVAALPSQASGAVIKDGVNGAVSPDLKEACLRALALPRGGVRDTALASSWRASAELFLKTFTGDGI